MLCLALVGWIGSTTARATSVETLLMPGKVSQAHVKQEITCTNCHDRTNVRKQSALCLDCHKPIAADLSTHRGYHGRMPNADKTECVACHTEHKGRDADIVQLNRAQFDHDLTEFRLDGAHAALRCEGCHKPRSDWRQAPTTCAGCHRTEDVHRGQFTAACSTCHGTTTWTGGQFDHGKTTFALTGAHKTLACTACHANEQYKPTPKTCAGCHQTDDVHRGARGSDCGRCHITTQWKNGKYDHLKETGYALLGVHADADCLACHRSGNYRTPIPKDCNGCHRADDAHGGRFGEKCADCHDNSKWQPVTYDHAARTRFALLGAHAKLECHACHTAPVASQKLPTDCAGCHRAADPHAGKLHGGCETCHGQSSWTTDVSFDHDLGSFPLLGLHKLVSCAQCHATMAFDRAPTACVDCHRRDDVHKGGLGGKCQACHSTNGWSVWTFDHARETGFALLGAHGKLQCAACHQQPPGSVKLSQQCVACHHKDDRHLGQYGEKCERCHSVDSWKGARIQ
jgi:Cytochrome c3